MLTESSSVVAPARVRVKSAFSPSVMLLWTASMVTPEPPASRTLTVTLRGPTTVKYCRSCSRGT